MGNFPAKYKPSRDFVVTAKGDMSPTHLGEDIIGNSSPHDTKKRRRPVMIDTKYPREHDILSRVIDPLRNSGKHVHVGYAMECNGKHHRHISINIIGTGAVALDKFRGLPKDVPGRFPSINNDSFGSGYSRRRTDLVASTDDDG